MPKIIRAQYEDGVLMERHIEGSVFKARKWVKLVVHTVIAISLVALVVIAVHDSLALQGAMLEEANSDSCDDSI